MISFISELIFLSLSFFKIGLFGFGGGYAMISLIQQELITHSWMTMEEFLDIIAIAQMTPGAIAVNSGTFVGYNVSTVIGSFTATVSVIAPSFILVLLLAYYFKKVKDLDYIEKLLLFLRPAVIGLIIAAAFTIGKSSFVDIKSILIAAGVLILMLSTKIHPILLIVLAGFSGVLLYA
ncbi:MAG: chromate transporter [Halothermotrichaceae bacterium]